MASASLAGLPVQVGLDTAFTPAIAYALLGTSRMTAVTTAELLPDRQIASRVALALLAGIQRLGMVSHFISEPVLVGFIIGAGLLVASSQLGKIFGMSVPLTVGLFHGYPMSRGSSQTAINRSAGARTPIASGD
jgi:MFS superfamily sulfate permease-like transporter